MTEGDKKARDELRKNLKAMAEYADAASAEQREATAVNHLAAAFGIKQEAAEIRREHAAATGRQALRFSGFCSRYPSFPLYLGYDDLAGVSLHLSQKAMLPKLLTKFQEAPFFAAFREFKKQTPWQTLGNRAPGLVFPRKGIPLGLVIYQISGSEWLSELPGSAIVYRNSSGPVYGVRTFRSLVAGIRDREDGWRP